MALNSSLREGSVAGDYTIVKRLAEGGMGEVFIVRETAQGGGQEKDDTCVLKSVLCASNGDALREREKGRGEYVCVCVCVFISINTYIHIC